MCNTLDTKVIIYNVTSSDKPTFKEGHQFIANLAVIFFFFFEACNNFQSKKEDFICKQSDTDIFQSIKSQCFYTHFKTWQVFKINKYKL